LDQFHLSRDVLPVYHLGDGERVVAAMTICVKTGVTSLFLAAFAVASPSAIAADIASPPPVENGSQRTAEAVASEIENYVARRAALLALRAKFDVVSMEDIAGVLRGDLQELAGGAPSPWMQSALDRQLLSEIGYFAVSLKYLIEGGGPLWPTDRSEDIYVNDALVEIGSAVDVLPEIIDKREDPLPLLERLERIYWWTEGYGEIPPDQDHFGEVPALVEQALQAAGPQSST
jgi:hypothetical protein